MLLVHNIFLAFRYEYEYMRKNPPTAHYSTSRRPKDPLLENKLIVNDGPSRKCRYMAQAGKKMGQECKGKSHLFRDMI